jgi:hypothetical protein
VCPQASVAPKITHKNHASRKQFVLEVLSCIEEGEAIYTDCGFLMKQHFICVEL